MNDCVIYVRISDDREGAGLGVSRQEKDCRQLAKQLGWRVTHVYPDNDISAFSGKTRPEYDDMVAGIRAGEITHVLAWHTDRIHRTPRELEDYIDACETYGTVTHTVKSGIVDLSTPGGRAMARILCVWARYESDIKRERLRTWARQHAELGKNPGGIRPFGWHEKDRRKLDPAEHAVIVELAERILAGESLRSLVADLNSRGISTVTGKPWSTTVVKSMMIRPRLAGWRSHNGNATFARGEWAPALDELTWREVVAALTDPARRSGGSGTRVNLLTGLARCGICDEPVTIQYGGQKRPVNSRNAYGCKTCGTWRAQPAVDAYVEGAVVAYLEHLDYVPTTNADPAIEARCKQLRARIEETKAAFADDDLMSASDLLDVLRALKQELAVMDAKQLPARRSRLVAGLTGPDAAERWAALPLDRKRSVIAELLEVRILRAGPGRRVFREETVELIRRT